jgi:MaoC like domain
MNGDDCYAGRLPPLAKQNTTMTQAPAVRGKYFDEFKLGDELVSPARTITGTEIVNFACMSGDFNEIHIDWEKRKTFDRRCLEQDGGVAQEMKATLMYKRRPQN